MQVELVKTFRFEAAHLLPRVPADHKCRRLHGHSYAIELRVSGEADPETGWLMDFADISEVARPVIDSLDHRYLNEIDGLDNPTAENLAAWIWQRLSSRLSRLDSVTVRETCTSACVYRGPGRAS